MSLTKPNTLNRLSSIEVANAKPETGKTEKNLNDGGGLYCVVTETRKRWQYQFSLLGNKGKIWLGEYPKLSLAAARKMRNSAKELVDAGKDPRVEKQTAKIALQYSAANTFETVTREWHAKELASDKWKASHAARIMKRLERDIFPIIGKRTIESLETRDLLYPLNLVLKRGTYNLAQAYRQYITAIMRYAVQTGRIKTNPALDLQGAIASKKPKNRPSLQLIEIPNFLRRLKQHKCMAVTHLSTRFALLTGARSSEFRFAQWDEFDLTSGTWTIPDKREAVEGITNSDRGEKMERTRIIYLSNQIVEIVKELFALNGRSRFVFQGRKVGSPLSENTINKTLREMGYDTENDVCLHGFRTMMVSSLNESLQFSSDAIERHIGHEGKDKIRGIYNRNAQYLSERKKMLQWWADYLDAMEANGFIDPPEFLTA